MTTSSVRDALFELGRLSRDDTLTNHLLLEGLARVLCNSLDVGLVALGVFEKGIEHSSTACVVRGSWLGDHPHRLSDDLFWRIEDQALARRLSELKPGRVYHRPEFGAGLNGSSSRLFDAIDPGLAADDQALALFRRGDGLELLIGLHSPAGGGSLHRSTLQKAGTLAPFVARCWAISWRDEPDWVRDLKPPARLILGALLKGLDDDQISKETGLSYHSVRAHLKKMFRCADVRSRLHLMQACQAPCRLRDHDELCGDPVLPQPEVHTNGVAASH